MTDIKKFEKDIQALLSRISKDNKLVKSDGTKEPLESAIIVIPTLAERKYIDQALAVLNDTTIRIDKKNFWQNLLMLEALSGLSLRQIDYPDSETRIRENVKLVMVLSEKQQFENILRTSRSIVLAGLALKDSEVVESGLILARDSVEKGLKWSDDFDHVLNGLLALTDLYKISNDEATYAIITERIESLKFNSSDLIKTYSEPGYLARSGVILEKLGKKSEAEEIFSHLVKAFPPEDLDTSSLKFRVELGARLFGDIKTSKAEFIAEKNSEINTVNNTTISISELVLPAEKPGKYELPLVSAIVIQGESPEGVTETVSALLKQNVTPDELVIVWKGKGRSLNLPDYSGSLVQITIERESIGNSVWNLGIAAASGKWLWMLHAGVKPASDVLEKIVPFDSDKAYEAIHLSSKPGELKENLKELSISPSIEPEHVLFKKSMINNSAKNVKVKDFAFWVIVLESLKDVVWKEVVYKQSNPAFSMKPNLVGSLLGDASEIYRNFKVKVPEERKARQLFIEKTKNERYKDYKDSFSPLVSIIVDTMEDDVSSSKTLESVLQQTNKIPFEIITTTTESHSENFINTLNELGILNIRVDNNSTTAKIRNLAAKEAKGEFLVFLDKNIQVQENWLNCLIDPLELNHSIGIAGGLIHTQSGTILHAGIAFAEKSVPKRLHYGASILLSATQKQRYFQAVDGSMMMVRRKLFERLDGFDDVIGMPLSSFDLCLSARQKGVGVLFIPQARAQQEQVDDITPDKTWKNKWVGRGEEDLSIYAKMDGYNVDDGKLKPTGKTIPIQGKSEKRDLGHTSQNATVIHKKPENIEKDFVTLLVKAESQIKDGNYDKAEYTLNMARSQVNGNVSNRVQYWTLLGDARFRLDKPDEALECYHKAVKDDPDAQRAWIGIGTYHLVQGELEKAEEIFEKVISQNPDNLRGYLGRGNVKLQRQLPQDALESFQKAATLDPGYRPTIVGLVAAALQAEKMQEALPSLERYLEIHDEDMEARFHLAAIYYGISNLESALRETTRVLEAIPDHPGAKELMEHLKEGAQE